MADLGFEVETLRQWVDELMGDSAELEVQPMRGGGSCEMFDIHRGDAHWVMRRAPVTAVSATAHNVNREQKIIVALQDQPVRVPRVVGACEDHSVAGMPFFLMDFIDGEVIRRKLPQAYRDAPESQLAIGEEIVDALAELHAVDWRNTDLADLGKPDKFLERQVGRWLGQLENYRHREIEGIDAVGQWLERNRPASGDLSIMHGDYKVDNVMWSLDVPPRILAIVDFEMTTIGDPLIDLAYCLAFWPEEGNMLAIAGWHMDGGVDPAYCQTPGQLIARYAESSGRDLGDFNWYQAFACWKQAIVMEASYAKFLSGESKNPNHEFFGFVVDELMKRARAFAA